VPILKLPDQFSVAFIVAGQERRKVGTAGAVEYGEELALPAET
jgi:hypothetical protein